MKILKPVLSVDAPNIKDALWIQPTKEGLEIKALDNGKWKSVAVGAENSVDLSALKKEILGTKSDKSSAQTLYGLRKYIDEQIEALGQQ
jgi:hypothetical protein